MLGDRMNERVEGGWNAAHRRAFSKTPWLGSYVLKWSRAQRGNIMENRLSGRVSSSWMKNQQEGYLQHTQVTAPAASWQQMPQRSCEWRAWFQGDDGVYSKCDVVLHRTRWAKFRLTTGPRTHEQQKTEGSWPWVKLWTLQCPPSARCGEDRRCSVPPAQGPRGKWGSGRRWKCAHTSVFCNLISSEHCSAYTLSW